MYESSKNSMSSAATWLKFLIYICAVSVLSSFLNVLPFVPASLTTWISRGVMAAMAICTYNLAVWNIRYKKAAIFRGIMLGCTLAAAYLVQSAVLSLVASICSFVSVYEEYCAHAELIAAKDQNLSDRWHSLFLWSIIAGVLTSFGATAVALLMIVAMQEGNASEISSAVLVLLSIPQIVIHIVYIRYLRKMIAHLSQDAEMSSDAL